jgi:hypothetical protein
MLGLTRPTGLTRVTGLTMRGRLATAVAAVAGAALVATATPAAAAPILNVTGGHTTTISTPEISRKLVGAGIVPLPVSPGTLDKIDLSTLQVTTTLPITSGRLDQGAFFAGDATTRGGLQFINLLAFRQVTLTDLKVFIDFADPRIEATIQGTRGQKVKLFKIDISGVQFGGNGTDTLELNNNKLLLAPEGAALLNGRLRTEVFTADAVFGTANTTFRYTVAP